MKYEKTEYVEAIQFTDCSPETISKIKAFVGASLESLKIDFKDEKGTFLTLSSDNGYGQSVSIGDYIVKNEKQQFWVMGSSEFEAKYKESSD